MWVWEVNAGASGVKEKLSDLGISGPVGYEPSAVDARI